MTYNDLNTTVSNLLVVDITDANYLQMLPIAISDAQTRICRDVDFLGANVTSVVGPLTANNRNLDWTDSFFAVEQVNVLSPAGQSNPDQAGVTRNPVLFATKDVCDTLYPSSSGAGIPSMLGRVTQSTAVLAPWPDAGYYVEVTGTQRPAVLSSGTQSNFISTNLADLLLAAVMIEMAAWALDFDRAGGGSADNPALATNWSAHYAELLKSAVVEEARKKFQAEGWSPAQPSPVATPPRT